VKKNNQDASFGPFLGFLMKGFFAGFGEF